MNGWHRKAYIISLRHPARRTSAQGGQALSVWPGTKGGALS
ncbi:hypothetical protein [Geobacillus sp. TFV-3]|nr:hypothetical protein [Geobacillus sp. TFV-3]